MPELNPSDSNGFEVPWAWERESRGPKPKSLKQSLEKVSVPFRRQVSKKVRKVKNKSENGSLETFRTFFGTTFGLLGPRLFRDFLTPETPSPRSTEPQI